MPDLCLPVLTQKYAMAGLMVGVLIQSCSYIVLLSRMDWAALAAAVAASQQPSKPVDQNPA